MTQQQHRPRLRGTDQKAETMGSLPTILYLYLAFCVKCFNICERHFALPDPLPWDSSIHVCMTQLCMMQVNVAIMLAPVTFLGHITSQPVEAMARMQTDRVSHHITSCLLPCQCCCYCIVSSTAAAAPLSAALLLLLNFQRCCCCCALLLLFMVK